MKTSSKMKAPKYEKFEEIFIFLIFTMVTMSSSHNKNYTTNSTDPLIMEVMNGGQGAVIKIGDNS